MSDYNRPYLVDGVVVDTSDPQEMGRFRVWCPAIDGGDINLENLPWVIYVSPLAGQAYNYPAGGSGQKSIGPVSYGFWAIPKIGSRVIISFLYGDYNQRIYLGSIFGDHGNRSLPNGRNAEGAASTSDSFEAIEPMTSNLKAQFQGKLSDPIAQSRGVYERQVAQAADTKNPNEGYDNRVTRDNTESKAGDLDPQTYCITTPGRHSIIMQDNPKFARVRIKTAEGHQIILDDANERIYISTSKGRTWIELDVDGHINMYGAESVSVSAGSDFNIQALGDVNIAAGGSVNISAAKAARISACEDVSISGDEGVNITSGAEFNILAAGTILQTGSTIHLNGPNAKQALCSGKPSTIPSHEPWTRNITAGVRGKNWKP